MTEAIKPFDAAEYLRDEADVTEYLAAAAEEGDPAIMALALGVVARARNMAQLARDTGITREGLYKALSPGGNPSFVTVAKVAAALGHPLMFAGAAHERAAQAYETLGAAVLGQMASDRAGNGTPETARPKRVAKVQRTRTKATAAT